MKIRITYFSAHNFQFRVLYGRTFVNILSPENIDYGPVCLDHDCRGQLNILIVITRNEYFKCYPIYKPPITYNEVIGGLAIYRNKNNGGNIRYVIRLIDLSSGRLLSPILFNILN